jgi:MoaA/NifB/PqqE/SkfB family radical SAM enzyme
MVPNNAKSQANFDRHIDSESESMSTAGQNLSSAKPSYSTHRAGYYLTKCTELYWTVTRLLGFGHWHDGSRPKRLSRSEFLKKDLLSDIEILDQYERRALMPKKVLVQISRRCNLKCSMCGWNAWGRNAGFMTLDLFKRVLSEMKLNGINNVALTNPQGEPLLSPYAEDCITLALEAGFYLELSTNCTTLASKNIKVICEAAKSGRFTVQASFSGYDKASHEAVYVGSKFDETSRKLCELNRALADIGLERVLTVNGITIDASTTDKHLAYLKSLGIDSHRVAINLPDNFAGKVDIGTKDNPLGLSSFKTDLDVRGLRLCNMIVTQMLVYDNGKVSACACRDSEGVMEIGDLSKQSLADIRRSPELKAMIKSFMDRNLAEMPLCQKCDIPYGDAYYPSLFVGENYGDKVLPRESFE